MPARATLTLDSTCQNHCAAVLAASLGAATNGPSPVQSEELEQRLRRRVRRLVGEIMPAVEGKAAHVDRPFPPGRKRTLGLGRDAAGGAPDREQRTSDLLARRARFLVVGEIGGAAGAIVLAGRVDAHRIIEEGVVMG